MKIGRVVHEIAQLRHLEPPDIREAAGGGGEAEVRPDHVVSVSAPSAAVADGISTALCALPKSQIDAVIGSFPEARVEMHL